MEIVSQERLGTKRIHPDSAQTPNPLPPYDLQVFQEELSKDPPSLQGWERHVYDLIWMTDFEVLSKVGLQMISKVPKAKKNSATIAAISPLLFEGDFEGAESRLAEIAAAEEGFLKDSLGKVGSEVMEEGVVSDLEKKRNKKKKKKDDDRAKDPLLGKTMKELVDSKGHKTRKDRFAVAMAVLRDPPAFPVPPSLLIFAVLVGISYDDVHAVQPFVKQLCDLRKTQKVRIRHTVTSTLNSDSFFFESGIKALETLVPLQAIERLASKNLLPPSPSFPSGSFVPSYVGKVFNVAYKCAMLGDQNGAKHGAVLFDKNNKVLSVGWNHRYDCGKKSKKKIIHAEVHAMMQVADTSLFKDATIFILESHVKENCFCNAHPCPSCNNVLTKFGVKQAIFTTDDGNLGVWTFKQKEDLETPTYDLAKSEGTFLKDEKLTGKFISALNIG
mmetsp:Transcript_8219/g.16587  ORF Transcript_8219/g.16587 Transcript_8219/m.16587 type:complete len:443 (+) Transcript_8219:34-1362(+)